MLRRFPGSLRWRQALPPLFVLGLLGLTVAWFWLPLAGWLLLTMLIIYSLALMLGGLDVALQQGKAYMLFAIPLAIATMHVSWGCAFLWSLLKNLFAGKGKRKPIDHVQ
jgi:hypothetical protein